MNKSEQISYDERWQAVLSCNKSYDGLFFYGVKTTGIFCRPSCRAKTPTRENVVFFDNVANAMAAGFRSCKKCCPDIADFKPDLDLMKKANDIFGANYDNSMDLSHISKQLGVSTNHLARLFKQRSGLTPTQYIIKLRVAKAAELLGQADTKIIEIAYMTGFKSLSNFYKSFKKQTGVTPREYRKKQR